MINIISNNTFFRQTRSIICFLVLFTFGSISVFSQQDAQYTQYMYNTLSVNPGYAGSRGHMSITALYRSQWVGLEGAPTTQTLNIHSPIGYRGVGLGLSIINDKIGPVSETSTNIDFSYTVYTSFEGRLSFGLKTSANLLDVRFSELNQNIGQGPDKALYTDIRNKLSPNIGAGIYYHTNKYYIGLSVPRFLETDYFDKSKLSIARDRMNFYLITGYVFDINNFLKFKPAIMAKAVEGAPVQLDLSANFMFDDKLIFGAAYRWDASVSGLVGFYLSDGFLIGITYDKEITELGGITFNSGSFEAIIRYDFIKALHNIKSPRFF